MLIRQDNNWAPCQDTEPSQGCRHWVCSQMKTLPSFCSCKALCRSPQLLTASLCDGKVFAALPDTQLTFNSWEVGCVGTWELSKSLTQRGSQGTVVWPAFQFPVKMTWSSLSVSFAGPRLFFFIAPPAARPWWIHKQISIYIMVYLNPKMKRRRSVYIGKLFLP